ncbi:MAG TPA: DUF4296 domain-containing protein [Bacteroidales bacterium]|nr:DUF4296 domain-containing protein [Bacteroidales bacterium]
MFRFLLLVSAASVLLFGCRKKENSYFIPAEDFKEIICDFHLADGLYMVNSRYITFHNDSFNFYNDILKEHGYTFAQFDSTLKFYTDNPEKLDRIYGDIVTEFNKLEHMNSQLGLMDDSISNLYTGKKRWILPKDGPTKRVPFDIAVQDSGEYTILVFAKKGLDDKSKDLRITAFYYYKDSASNKEHTDYFPEATYEPGKRFAIYSTSKFLSDKKVKRLRGWILDYDQSAGSIHRDIEVKMIAIRRNLRERAQ